LWTNPRDSTTRIHPSPPFSSISIHRNFVDVSRILYDSRASHQLSPAVFVCFLSGSAAIRLRRCVLLRQRDCNIPNCSPISPLRHSQFNLVYTQAITDDKSQCVSFYLHCKTPLHLDCPPSAHTRIGLIYQHITLLSHHPDFCIPRASILILVIPLILPILLLLSSSLHAAPNIYVLRALALCMCHS